ncbi:MAG: hypothetical protein LBJ97_01400 [Mycoplasmataceae bacterium]|jgi:hypothetical protein|nr:hypothetical protein [Mycoplasmataceae bacterium]
MKDIDGKLVKADHSPVEIGDKIKIITNATTSPRITKKKQYKTSKKPTLRELMLQLITRFDNLVKVNSLKE